ncbi:MULTISPECIES: family 43 glycosylhydrolase [unclassified Pseudoalteromonas]|uniref:glycoside hydrolase family 117 protein n=1 Tax=unclassified Pseudoalteromonas TaxID=194690 RepID=UPI000B3D40FB|nr:MULTISPECIES: family 43 glycosylhydrolase [unclassified Pseudoalteromonas]MDN3377455.1 family 43 glycosylhydrolase [Pseudoalteromonas sp. APC 3893]MDN3385378.1 family 43 glycosylhydrolase [Pseudoalteromonas sp. APC 4017]OUS72321.1 glycosyl hydrolase [Pseudoalteromonas sp. A601]
MSDNQQKLSLASLRAIERGYDSRGPQWLTEFDVTPLKGDFAYQEGVIRRDPSSVLYIEGVYHCWYTKGEGETLGFNANDPEAKVFPWDLTEVWHATSKDSITWQEQGVAIARGEAGQYDDRAVFTPEVFAHLGKYYLVYQTVETPYTNRQYEHIAIAHADSPFGPWHKSPAPIVSPSKDGVWSGEEDNRFAVSKKGSFDSHKVHDPCLVFFQNKFYLYYKGETQGEGMNFGGREIKHGVAIADDVMGPYVKSEFNPISNSGHEVVVWNFRGGIASLLTTDGPEKNTIQFAKDGINFEIMAHIKGGPEAIGLYRPSKGFDENPAPGLSWGLCHKYDASWNWNYICRFTPRKQVLDAGTFQNSN